MVSYTASAPFWRDDILYRPTSATGTPFLSSEVHTGGRGLLSRWEDELLMMIHGARNGRVAIEVERPGRYLSCGILHFWPAHHNVRKTAGGTMGLPGPLGLA